MLIWIIIFDLFREFTGKGASGNESGNGNRISYDEFGTLVRRIDRMEYSIGNVVSRVRRIWFSLIFKKWFFYIDWRCFDKIGIIRKE